MYCAESLPHPSQGDHLHHATPAKFVGRRLADLRNLTLRRTKPESIHHVHSHANSWCARPDLGLAEPHGTQQSRHSAETSNLPRGLNIQGHLEPAQSRDANARQSSAGLLFTPHVSAHPAVPTTLGESTSQPPVLVKTGAHASDITKVAAVPLHVLETAASPVYRNVQKVNAAVASRIHPLTGEAVQPTTRPSAVESAPEVKQPSSQNFPPSSSSTYWQSPAREVASSGKSARDNDVGSKGVASHEAHVSPRRASMSPDRLAHSSSTPDTIAARSTTAGSNGLESDAAQSLMQVVSTDQGLVPATLVTTAAPMVYKTAPMVTRRSEDERRHSTGGKDHVSRRHRFKHKLAHIFHPRRSKSVVDPSGLSAPPEPAGAHHPAETANNGAQLYQIDPHTPYHLLPGDSQHPAVLVDPIDHEAGAALGLYRVGHGETTLASPQRQPRPRHGQRTQTWHDRPRHSHSIRRQQRRRERRRRLMGAGSASSSCDTNCSCRDGSSSGGGGPTGEGSTLTTSVSGLSLRSTIGSRSVASSADMRMMDSHRDTEL
ncbi:hypothetical protein IWQ60_000812 [Tieghemiomyces parasiticus]|uniref:Uncharacterized protein n=1 Tax=Tieghemiomyces parasiticus TaxID=78921 RepID=A0A9W8AHT8_9FUNG|nr:hypothetical protein IWQ60_000812 [Tieghemiomyces parasiticus]